MKYIAAFDIGTTAVKGVLCGTDGTLAASASIDIPTIFRGEIAEYKEQDPLVWYEAFCRISAGFFAESAVPGESAELAKAAAEQAVSGERGTVSGTPDGLPGPAAGSEAAEQKTASCFKPEDVLAIVMSGQMQDVIPVDKELMPVGNAILYSDGRGEPQSDAIKAALGEDYLEKSTGNHYDGSLSFPKLVWIKEMEPERFARIHKVLISSKDYVNARLTGRACGDVTACATAGAMDIHEKKWDKTIIEAMGISAELFPELHHSHERAGTVTERAAAETGYKAGTPVYAGVGDAGATTLASGISDLGQYNINLGTSGWVAAVSDDVLPARMGVFNLAAMPEGKYINVVPFLNAGNVHKWISGLFTQEEPGAVESGERETESAAPTGGGEKKIDYDAAARLLERSRAGSSGTMFLPYLSGERFPVMDAEIRGCFVGLSPETDRSDMIRACLEGVAFSIRQGIESIGTPPKKVSIIGGGGRVTAWCQILADVLNQTVYVYRNSDILPSLAISAAALIGEGEIDGYDSFTDSLQDESACIAYRPIAENAAKYDEIYPRYLRIYPAVKQI